MQLWGIGHSGCGEVVLVCVAALGSSPIDSLFYQVGLQRNWYFVLSLMGECVLLCVSQEKFMHRPCLKKKKIGHRKAV